MILDLICIWFICVLVIDISGFIDSIKYGISYFLTKGKIPTTDYRLKPLDCSLCATTWCGLIYVLVTNQFSFPIMAFILLLAVFTPILKDIIILLKDICIKIINKFYE